jgi:hypothetical protein
MSQTMRSYTELSQIHDFYGRYRYLRLNASIGIETFGFDRWLNQRFYTSAEWRSVRNHVIARDRGCDLGIDGYEIYDGVAIHHMNPITADQVIHRNRDILDPEYLISVSLQTHNAIHFGDERSLREPLIVRQPGDTKLW